MGMITQLVKNYDNALQAGADFYNAYNNANGLVEVIENHLLNDANVSEEISGLIGEYGLGTVVGAIVTGTLVVAGALPVGAATALGVIAGIPAGELGKELAKEVYRKTVDPDNPLNVPAPTWNEVKQFDPFTNDRYSAARGWIARDPLAIDLDGDGIETVGIAGGVLFDHDGDGIKTGTGWVKSDDALVVLDRNANGTIDTGAELFGVDYLKSNGQKALNGFDALTDLDTNHDNLFNSSDAQYANVRLWRDMNQDGISQAGELQSLSQAGITAINLTAHTATKNLGNGNTQTLAAATAGIVGDTVALNLADNPFYRQYPDHLDTTAVATLPDMQGAGRVRDLQEAATLSTTLAAQLADLQANYRTHDQFEASLDSLIQNWANTSDWQTTPVGYQAPTLFSGGNFSGLPIAETSPGLHLMHAPAVLGGGMVPYAIIYQPDGVTKEQLWGAYREQLDGSAPPLPEKYLRAVYLIETLERYNGLPFINFNIETGSITTATGRAIPPEQAGGGSVQTYPIPIYVPINDAQLALLEQSYAALKQSIGDGLLLQTRLKGYMDAIALQIDATGIRLDFSGVETLLANRKATDAKAALHESRRWRDGTARRPIRHPYAFHCIDMSSGHRYPAGIPIQTRRQAGKKDPLREARPGTSAPVPIVIMGVKKMRRATNQQYSNTGQATGESRRWRDGVCGSREAANDGTWRRVA